MSKRKKVYKNLYTTVTPEELWNEFSEVYRCGRPSHPNLKKLRLGKDLSFATDPLVQEKMVIPDPAKGISFADSIATLKSQPVSGVAWVLKSNKWLPEGLVFNYKDKWHPLLNVSEPMSESRLLQKLKELTGMMECTKIKV